ncbi:salivary anticoagulant protein P23-like isoform X2 [Haemaphysalis longicornis]
MLICLRDTKGGEGTPLLTWTNPQPGAASKYINPTGPAVGSVLAYTVSHTRLGKKLCSASFSFPSSSRGSGVSRRTYWDLPVARAATPTVPSREVASTGITNIDLKAHVVRAGFKNFETAVRRVGDCTPGEDVYRRVPRQASDVRSRTLYYGNTTITCTFAFDGIKAYLVVEARGDSIFDTLKTVVVEASMHDTTARFEVTTAQDKPAHVRTFILESVGFRIWPDEEELDLTTSRMESFKSVIAQQLTEEFVRKVYVDYRRLLNHACSRINFSLAS